MNPRNKGFLVNVSRFRVATHMLKANCAEIAEDRPKQPAYEILSIKPRS